MDCLETFIVDQSMIEEFSSLLDSNSEYLQDVHRHISVLEGLVTVDTLKKVSIVLDRTLEIINASRYMIEKVSATAVSLNDFIHEIRTPFNGGVSYWREVSDFPTIVDYKGEYSGDVDLARLRVARVKAIAETTLVSLMRAREEVFELRERILGHHICNREYREIYECLDELEECYEYKNTMADWQMNRRFAVLDQFEEKVSI